MFHITAQQWLWCNFHEPKPCFEIFGMLTLQKINNCRKDLEKTAKKFNYNNCRKDQPHVIASITGHITSVENKRLASSHIIVTTTILLDEVQLLFDTLLWNNKFIPFLFFLLALCFLDIQQESRILGVWMKTRTVLHSAIR